MEYIAILYEVKTRREFLENVWAEDEGDLIINDKQPSELLLEQLSDYGIKNPKFVVRKIIVRNPLKTVYNNGHIVSYRIYTHPSIEFTNEEDAKLALALDSYCKYNQIHNDFSTILRYVFRVLGSTNEWTK